MLYAYLSPPWKALRSVVVRLHAVLLQLHFLWVCILLGLFTCWFLLAAIIYPDRYLPYGTMLVVLVVVLQTLSKELLQAADKLAVGVHDAVGRVLASKLEHAKQQIELSAFEVYACCALAI